MECKFANRYSKLAQDMELIDTLWNVNITLTDEEKEKNDKN